MPRPDRLEAHPRVRRGRWWPRHDRWLSHLRWASRGEARWAGTPVEAALPVTMLERRRPRRGAGRDRSHGGPRRAPHHGRTCRPNGQPCSAITAYSRVTMPRSWCESGRPAHRGRPIRSGTRGGVHVGLRSPLVPSALRGVEPATLRCGSSWWPGPPADRAAHDGAGRPRRVPAVRTLTRPRDLRPYLRGLRASRDRHICPPRCELRHRSSRMAA